MYANLDSLSEGAGLEALDGRAGPARRLSAEESEAAVHSALKRAFPARRAPFERPRLSLLLVAAALAVTGLSAALVITRPAWFGASATKAGSVPIGVPAQQAPPTKRAPQREAQPSSVLQPTVAPEPPSSAEATDRSSVRASPSAGAPSAERVPSARASSALDLLKAANQLRRQGRWADAERAYAQIASSHGSSAQGPVAALAAASLRLEHLRDPRGALRLYQTALRASSLSVEAELGMAECYRVLGEREAETSLLRRLTSAHPQALFRERALHRLQALEGGKP